jgi:hypothetical protein
VNQFPLLFRLHTLVVGKGFIADVDMRGRVLLTTPPKPGDGRFWLDGVMPGGVAAGGDTIPEAHVELQNSIRGILSEIADESGDFTAFKAQVDAFFAEVDEEDSERWLAAVRAVRAGNCGAGFVPLKKLPAEDERSVRVVQIDPARLTPELNRLPLDPRLAA